MHSEEKWHWWCQKWVQRYRNLILTNPLFLETMSSSNLNTDLNNSMYQRGRLSTYVWWQPRHIGLFHSLYLIKVGYIVLQLNFYRHSLRQGIFFDVELLMLHTSLFILYSSKAMLKRCEFWTIERKGVTEGQIKQPEKVLYNCQFQLFA